MEKPLDILFDTALVSSLTIIFLILCPGRAVGDDTSSFQELLSSSEKNLLQLDSALIDREAELLKKIKDTLSDAQSVPTAQRAQLSSAEVHFISPSTVEETTSIHPRVVENTLEDDAIYADLQELEVRARVIDHRLDRLQNELLGVRSRTLLTGIKTDELHEEVSELTRFDNHANEDGGDSPKHFQNTTYSLPIHDSRQRESEGKKSNSPLMDKRVSRDTPIAQISSKTAPLLSGPERSFPTVFRALKGDTIVVEKRHEDWYRVLHSSGARGWLASKDLLFGRTSSSLPDEVIRIKGYNPGTDRTNWES